MLSRVADSLYWVSRYIERAEHTARAVNVHLNGLVEEGGLSPEVVQARWRRLYDGLQLALPAVDPNDDRALAHHLTLDVRNPASVVGCVAAARENARQVREQISTEMWYSLNRFYLTLRAVQLQQMWDEPHQFYSAVRDGAHLIQGVTAATMLRGPGWYFGELGTYIERMSAGAGLLRASAELLDSGTEPQGRPGRAVYFEWLNLLKSFMAFEAYCKVYSADLKAAQIVEMLVLNAEFPHGARFCAGQVQMALAALHTRKNARVVRLAGRLRSTLDFDQREDIFATGLAVYMTQVQQQTAQIHEAIYETFINYPIEQALP